MLPCPGFRNHPGFAHVLGQQRLANGVVHLVGTGVVEIFTLEPDLGATELLGPSLREIQGRRTTHVMGQVVIEIRTELRIILETIVHGLQFIQSPHQGLRDKAAPVGTKMATCVRKSRKIRAFRHQLLLVF